MKKVYFGLLYLLSTIGFAETAAESLQQKLNAIRTMTAAFDQSVTVKKREISRSAGTMALQRPGRFRWVTNDPMEQIIIADGKKMWIYDVELEQVTVKNQEKGLGGTAALFLSGYDNTITSDFDVQSARKGATTVYDLHSKSSKENFQEIKLIFTKDILTGMELYDQLGQHTMVRLKNIKSNPTVPLKWFAFKPPKGVDVVKQ